MVRYTVKVLCSKVIKLFKTLQNKSHYWHSKCTASTRKVYITIVMMIIGRAVPIPNFTDTSSTKYFC